MVMNLKSKFTYIVKFNSMKNTLLTKKYPVIVLFM